MDGTATISPQDRDHGDGDSPGTPGNHPPVQMSRCPGDSSPGMPPQLPRTCPAYRPRTRQGQGPRPPFSGVPFCFSRKKQVAILQSLELKPKSQLLVWGSATVESLQVLNKGKCVNIGMIFIQKILQIGLCAKRCSRPPGGPGRAVSLWRSGVGARGDSRTERGAALQGRVDEGGSALGFHLHEPDCCVLDAPASRGLPSALSDLQSVIACERRPSLLEHCSSLC